MAIPTPPPSFGQGKPTEATIDQVNIAMRGMPWYQEQMRQWGQDPGHPNLAKSQSKQIMKLAQANGIQVDEGNMELDDHGNFNPIGHKLRNTLIVAGLAAATIATMGAAGAFGGAGLGMAGGASGAGAAGAGGAGAAGLGAGSGISMAGIGTGGLIGGAAPALGSTAIGTGMLGGIAGGTGLAGAGATMAGMVGAPLAATQTVAGSAALPGGLAPSASGTAALQAARTGAGGAGSVMSRFLNPDSLSKLANTVAGVTSGIQNNRLHEGNYTQEYDKLMMEAQTGRNQNESDALKKLAQTSYIAGGGSKYKPTALTLNGKTYAPNDLGYGPSPTTDVEKAGANALQSQLVSRLGPGGSYTPQPLSNYATPGAGETAGNWAGPILSGAGTIANMLGYGK